MKKERAVALMGIVIFTLLFNLFTTVNARAQKVGYDENTEIAVKGVVQKEAAHPYKGLSNFFLKTKVKR